MQSVEIIDTVPAVSGKPWIDAIARDREAANPSSREISSCQNCGAEGSNSRLWCFRWRYFFTPNWIIAVLAPIAAAVGAALVHYTREVQHETFHVLCSTCAGKLRRGRILGAILRFAGLFISIVSFGLVLAGIVWWFIAANERDRIFVQTWITVPAVTLFIGILINLCASRLEVPKAIRPLLRRPFHFVSALPANA